MLISPQSRRPSLRSKQDLSTNSCRRSYQLNQTIPRSISIKHQIKERNQELPIILVTGATGYIGSHVILELLRTKKYQIIAIDNLSNSSSSTILKIKSIFKDSSSNLLKFYQIDLNDSISLSNLFKSYRKKSSLNSNSNSNSNHHPSLIQHVIHFAALKSVSNSHLEPENYYQTNVIGTETLIKLMKLESIPSLIFSSSAVVYGKRLNHQVLIESDCLVDSIKGASEESHQRIMSPYGYSKLRCEEIVHSATLDGQLKAVILRYSNPSGNDPSGLIGDSPKQPENLIPIVCEVLKGKRDHLCIYGDKFDTQDGTGVRDFIHVQDLAKGHLAALYSLEKQNQPKFKENCRTYNLSTGKGTSVKEVINCLEIISGFKIKTIIKPPRLGDLDKVICDSSKAFKELNWKSEKTIFDMARDMWTFCLKNPNGLN
ncbi:hypothetical protein DFH28DRAFT_899109 [Melampsora americana]|nr:hypothetical protein DFH28DRAFT_899109 [Melampsora americana]